MNAQEYKEFQEHQCDGNCENCKYRAWLGYDWGCVEDLQSKALVDTDWDC